MFTVKILIALDEGTKSVVLAVVNWDTELSPEVVWRARVEAELDSTVRKSPGNTLSVVAELMASVTESELDVEGAKLTKLNCDVVEIILLNVVGLREVPLLPGRMLEETTSLVTPEDVTTGAADTRDEVYKPVTLKSVAVAELVLVENDTGMSVNAVVVDVEEMNDEDINDAVLEDSVTIIGSLVTTRTAGDIVGVEARNATAVVVIVRTVDLTKAFVTASLAGTVVVVEIVVVDF